MFKVIDKTTGEIFTVYGMNGTHFIVYDAEHDLWFYKNMDECRPYIHVFQGGENQWNISRVALYGNFVQKEENGVADEIRLIDANQLIKRLEKMKYDTDAITNDGIIRALKEPSYIAQIISVLQEKGENENDCECKR